MSPIEASILRDILAAVTPGDAAGHRLARLNHVVEIAPQEPA